MIEDRVENLKQVLTAMADVSRHIRLAPYRFEGDLLESHLRGYRRKMRLLRQRYRRILRGKK